MLKRYTFWLTAGVLFQFLSAILHSISFIVTPELHNETERQIHSLITGYREDMGAGFHRSFFDLFTAVSACYPLLCLLGGLTLGYLLLKDAGLDLMRGTILINVVIFGVCLLVMALFTFLPPILMTGLIFGNLLISYLLVPSAEEG